MASEFKIVNKIRGTVGSDSDIHLAASIPLMSGMPKSRTTTSGLSSWNLLTPDHPFSASPQTSQYWELMTSRRIRRVVSESSTINTRSDLKLNPHGILTFEQSHGTLGHDRIERSLATRPDNSGFPLLFGALLCPHLA